MQRSARKVGKVHRKEYHHLKNRKGEKLSEVRRRCHECEENHFCAEGRKAMDFLAAMEKSSRIRIKTP